MPARRRIRRLLSRGKQPSKTIPPYLRDLPQAELASTHSITSSAREMSRGRQGKTERFGGL